MRNSFIQLHMPVVTFTCDFGIRDYYLAALKGSVLTLTPDATLVDISVTSKQYDIREAAYTFRNSFDYFPKGTIHVLHVNSAEAVGRLLVSILNGQYIVSFDNGLLALAFGNVPSETYEVNEELKLDDGLGLFRTIARVVDLLAKEYQPTDFCHPAVNVRSYRMLQAMYSPGLIKAVVVYIDDYGNAILNISKTEFEKHVGNKRFTIQAKMGQTNFIANNYSDAEEGDFVCVFNRAGLLELAINKGRASSLLGLNIDSVVLITIE